MTEPETVSVLGNVRQFLQRSHGLTLTVAGRRRTAKRVYRFLTLQTGNRFPAAPMPVRRMLTGR